MSLRDALARARPRRVPFGGRMRGAAVAVVFRTTREGPALLFIERPTRAGDRWSGHVAFPGGVAHADDPDDVATARREAREEVGLDVGAPVGRLSELLTAEPGRARPMRVAPIVFDLVEPGPLVPCPREVAAAFWAPWRDVVRAPRERVAQPVLGLRVPFDAIRVEGRVVWGLTLRMIDELARVLGEDP